MKRHALHRSFASAFGLLALALATGSCTSGSTPTSQPSADAPRLLEELGDQKHPITTASPLAQRYFDQAMILVFGFNHEAAIASFEEAARLDPGCAMCHWGIALAFGPNINLPMGPEAAARAYAETQQARALMENATPRERAYIEALSTRYADPAPEDRAALDLAYANAMRELHHADRDDLDAATLFAESLLDLYPWNYWTDDAQPREYTPEALEVLEGVMAAAPLHVGANHYYIHAVEEFQPERAEAAADRLGSVAPDAGHLVHMPSHIYWRVGRYEDANLTNQKAAAADERFFSWCRPGAFYRAAYYPHNVHFLWAAASIEGQRDLALSSARKLAAETKPAIADVPFLQEFVAIPMLTQARFGLWDSVLGEAKPAADHVYLTGIWHYTRGLAKTRLGDLAAAQSELAALEAVAAGSAAEELILSGGTASARKLLEIGSAHLTGELAAARGDNEAAVAALELAAERHDGLIYMEPPPWYAPPRQSLGAVLLSMGEAEKAEAVYRADLEQYPKNGWSLFGLTKSLEARGKKMAANGARQQFEAAWARADVPLESSRF